MANESQQAPNTDCEQGIAEGFVPQQVIQSFEFETLAEAAQSCYRLGPRHEIGTNNLEDVLSAAHRREKPHKRIEHEHDNLDKEAPAESITWCPSSKRRNGCPRCLPAVAVERRRAGKDGIQLRDSN